MKQHETLPRFPVRLTKDLTVDNLCIRSRNLCPYRINMKV